MLIYYFMSHVEKDSPLLEEKKISASREQYGKFGCISLICTWEK